MKNSPNLQSISDILTASNVRTAPDLATRQPHHNGPQLVVVRPGEEVAWTWTTDDHGQRYVCGYTIIVKEA